MQPSNPYESYLQNQVFSASPLELTVMLYRAAIDALKSAMESTAEGDIRARGNSASRASAIVIELVNALDEQQGGQIAADLRALYDYVLTRIHEGHSGGRAESFAEAVRLLETLLESWQAITTQHPVPTDSPAHEPIECSF
jgi:flagellar secretion chaperone FliS